MKHFSRTAASHDREPARAPEVQATGPVIPAAFGPIGWPYAATGILCRVLFLIIMTALIWRPNIPPLSAVLLPQWLAGQEVAGVVVAQKKHPRKWVHEGGVITVLLVPSVRRLHLQQQMHEAQSMHRRLGRLQV